MKMSEIHASVRSLSENDLSIPTADIDRWVDDAINRINTTLEANIPTVSGKGADYIPEFDPRYHEILVLFAANRYRESDADFNSAQYFLANFNDMLMDMQRDMHVPPSLKQHHDYQQINVTDAGQTVYYLSMPTGSYFDLVRVYINDAEVNPRSYSISFSNRTITMKTSLSVMDKITVQFENNSDLNYPPYQWWGQNGW